MCFRRVPAAFVAALLLAIALVGGDAGAAVSELRLKRLNFIYRFQQGKNYWSGNSYLEAAAHFHSLMEQYHELPRPLQLQLNYYYGASLHEVELFSQAEKQLLPVFNNAASPPLVSDAAVRLMDIYARYRDAAQVQAVYERAIAKPYSPDLRTKIAYGAVKAYYRLGEYEKVRSIALKLDADSPEYPRALLLAAMGMVEAGELGAAEQDLLRLQRLAPGLREDGHDAFVDRATMLLAQVQFDQGQYGKTLQTLAQLRDPAYAADVLYMRAWSQVMLGQYMPGLEAFRTLATTYPGDQRSIEATLLGGYILMNLAQFTEAYATFATLEADYRSAAEKLLAFGKKFPSPQALDLYLSDTRRLSTAPIPPQIADWVYASRDAAEAEAVKQHIEELGRRIQDMLKDLKRMRVISAGFGSSFENPATLERLLRNEMGLKLAQIRSSILELMIKPVRNQLLAMGSQEYQLINLAQSTREAALDIIQGTANPTKERAVAIQRSLRKIQDYLYLVASERLSGQRDPAMKEIGDTLAFSDEPRELVLNLIEAEEGLALVLLDLMREEERLWAVIAYSTEVERKAAEAVLRRLGLWGRQAYLDSLELLYRSTSGIEEVLNENGELLLGIQTRILNEVLAYTADQDDDLERLRARYRDLLDDADAMRLVAVDRGYDQAVAVLREAEARAAGGQLDVGWRIKEVEEEIMRDVLVVEQERLGKLQAYYEKAAAEAQQVGRSVTVLDADIRRALVSSAAGNATVQLDRAIDAIRSELDRMQLYVDELQRGSARIVEQPGTVTWRPEVRP